MEQVSGGATAILPRNGIGIAGNQRTSVLQKLGQNDELPPDGRCRMDTDQRRHLPDRPGILRQKRRDFHAFRALYKNVSGGEEVDFGVED